MNKDRIKGAVEQAKGAVKEAAGKVTECLREDINTRLSPESVHVLSLGLRLAARRMQERL